MSKSYDIGIVGGGVIGSVLALHLARLDYQVLLLDADEPDMKGSDPERVIALSEGSKRYLDNLDVWQDMLDSGAGFIRHIVVREPGNVGAVDMQHTAIEDADALGYVLEIRHVLSAVQQAFSKNITLLNHAQCSGFTQTTEGVSLSIKTTQGEQNITASLLVGADGSNSFVRKHTNIGSQGWDHNRMGIVASVKASNAHQDTAYECFKKDGPLALLPLADGRFSIVWSVAPKTAVELMDLDDAGFLNMLKHEMGEDLMANIGAFEAVGKRATFPLELRIASAFAKGKVLLAGNAAHTIHPIAGQGMNLGLRDVAVLADILSQTWAKGDLSKALIGQTYAERRRPDTCAVVGFTEGILEAFSSSFFPQRWLRGVGLNMVERTPALKHILLEQAAGIGQSKRLSS